MEIEKLEENEEKKEKKEVYESKDGFITTPILRGLTEIFDLYQMIYNPAVPKSTEWEEAKAETEDETPGFGAFICGGYVRYMASPRQKPIPAGDVDIYCANEVSYLYLKKLLDKELEKRFENDVSFTYKRPTDPVNPFFAAPSVQLIKPIREGRIVATGEMSEILENFDFTVIRCGLQPSMFGGYEAVVDADFPHDEAHLILRLKNIHCPISSTLRCMKYAKKGYWLQPTQCVRLFQDWDARDDEYRLKILDFMRKLAEEGELTREEVDEMEALMRID